MARLGHWLEAALANLLVGIASMLPDRLADWLGARSGELAMYLIPSRARVASDNLRRAFPEKSDHEIGIICRGVFRQIGRVCFEMGRNHRHTPERLLQIIHSAELEKARGMLARIHAEGRGAIAMTAHFGNWELAGAWAAALGYPIDFLVATMKNELVDRLFTRQRAKLGVSVIHLWDNPRVLIRILRANRLCGMLCDQHAPGSEIIVPFFNQPVAVPGGAARMAVRMNCPIMLVLLRRIQFDSFELIVGPLLYPPLSGDEESDVVELSAAYTRFLESVIRAYPDQWLWTHRRWKLPPETPLHPKLKPLYREAVQAYVPAPVHSEVTG